MGDKLHKGEITVEGNLNGFFYYKTKNRKVGFSP